MDSEYQDGVSHVGISRDSERWGSEDAADRLAEVIATGGTVDLHSHSRYSDGDWTPSELIADARQLGLRLVSLTDHDTVSGQAEARAAAEASGLLFLTGMEVSLSVGGRPYHILAFDYDPEASTWERFAAGRQVRLERYYLGLFDQLRERGYAVSPDLARGENGRFVGNPLAVALHRAGLAPSVEAAWQRLRGLGLQWSNEQTYQDVHEFAELLRPGEAIFSVAHPARNEAGVSVRLTEDDLRELKRALPLVALEATHPYHATADVELFATMAARHSLAVSCGSDAHGQRHRRPLRPYPASLCAEFFDVVRGRWANRARAVVSV